MKKIIYLLILSLTVFGCSKDYLDRVPTTKKAVESFYKTPEDAAQALTAVYNVLYYGDWDNVNLISEIASDDCFAGAGKTDDDNYVRYDRFIPHTDDAVNSGPWSAGYAGVYRATVLLENLNNVDWKGDTTLKVRYAAEARFLRAYFYFNLTRMFGEIPLITQVVKPGENFPKAPAVDIYSYIIKDLQYTASNLPDVPYSGMDAANLGHVTKWAAESYIGRVFLFYTGYYNQTSIGSLLTKEQTRDYIDDVINNSGHTLVDTFARLFVVPAASTNHSYAGEGNIESVFAIKYTYKVQQNNAEHGGFWMSRMIGPRYTPEPPYGQGWGAGTVNPTLWNAYSIGDSRQSATILYWDGEGKTYDHGDQRQYTGYNWKKYVQLCVTPGQNYDVDLGSTDWQWDGYEDFMDMRFADVLLMGAELHLGDATAATYFNRVRDRAFLDLNHEIASPTFADIMNERRLELAMEGQRYWDLLRQCGTSFNVLINALNNTDPNGKSDNDLESFTVHGQNAADVKGLFQIPPSEIRLMNNIVTQNDGYPQ